MRKSNPVPFLQYSTVNQYVSSSHILRRWEKKKIRQIQQVLKLSQKEAVEKYMFIKGKLYSFLKKHPAVSYSDATQYIAKADFLKPNYEKVSKDGIEKSIALKKHQLLHQFQNRFQNRFMHSMIIKMTDLTEQDLKEVLFDIKTLLNDSKFYLLDITKEEVIAIIKSKLKFHIQHLPEKNKEQHRLTMNIILTHLNS